MLALTGKQVDIETLRSVSNGRSLHTTYTFRAATSKGGDLGEIPVHSSVYVATANGHHRHMGQAQVRQMFMSIPNQDDINIFLTDAKSFKDKPMALHAESPLREEEAYVLEVVKPSQAADAALSLEVARQLGGLSKDLRQALAATTARAVSREEEGETQALRMLNIAAQVRTGRLVFKV